METQDVRKRLIELQQDSIDFAKKTLQEVGNMPPYALVITTRSLVPDSLMKKSEVIHEPDNPDGTEEVVMWLNMQPSSDEMFAILYKYICSQPNPKLRILWEQLYKSGLEDGLDEKNVRRGMVQGFIKAQRMHEKDVAALGLELLIRDVKAHSYIMTMEAWTKTFQDEQAKEKVKDLENKIPIGSLKDDPTSQECICSILESLGLHRMVRIPVKRETRDVGKVLEFGEPEISESGTRDGNQTEGRFTGLLATPVTS